MWNVFKSHMCKYGRITGDGCQYCQICGKAHYVGPMPCVHNWKRINMFERRNGITHKCIGVTYVSECTKCGEIEITNT